MSFLIKELIERFEIEIIGDENNIISEIGQLNRQNSNSIYWSKNKEHLSQIRVGTVICKKDDFIEIVKKEKANYIITVNPRLLFAKIISLFFCEKFSDDFTNEVSLHHANKNIIIGQNVFIGKNVQIGNGPIQAELFNYVVVNCLEHRIKFLNLVPLNIVHSYTCGADLGINLLEDYNLSKSLASPNKLFEYIQAEIPVIASLSIENRKILDNYSIGLLTLNDPIKVAESIKKVSLEDKSIYSEPLIQAKKYFNWENQEKIFNQILNFI